MGAPNVSDIKILTDVLTKLIFILSLSVKFASIVRYVYH
jgi:hypothetical protein